MEDYQQKGSIHHLQNLILHYDTTSSDEDGLPDMQPAETDDRRTNVVMPNDAALCIPSLSDDRDRAQAQWDGIAQSPEKGPGHSQSFPKPTFSLKKSHECNVCHMVVRNLDIHRCARSNGRQYPYNCPDKTPQQEDIMGSDQSPRYSVHNETVSGNSQREHIPGDVESYRSSMQSNNCPDKMLKRKGIPGSEQPYECDDRNEAISGSSQIGHIPTNDMEFYRCSVCFRAFNTLLGVNIHKRVHAEYKLFHCDVCGKEFRWSTTLYRHKRSHVAIAPTSYECKVCGKVLVSRANLIIHSRVHTGQRPYKCDTCDKAFTQSSALTCHKRIHTNERPFLCNLCGRTFRQPVGLTYHKRTHTGERPYKCGQCGKTFSQAGPLMHHVRTHSGDF